MNFLVIHFDGYNVGLDKDFAEHYLVFETNQEALEIVKHWTNWMNGNKA